jgi:hypothetical protein
VAEAFIYGFGLAYVVLPNDILERLEADVRELTK